MLGDQLDLASSAFDGFDAAQDMVWMAEVAEESTHIWSGKQRIALFLAAMRHFALALRDAGMPLLYTRLDDAGNRGSLAAELQFAIEKVAPHRLVVSGAGDFRVYQAIQAVARQTGVPLEVREDRHFYATVRQFVAHAKDRKSLRMAYFYREMRHRHGVLMDDDQPAGGQWSFDADMACLRDAITQTLAHGYAHHIQRLMVTGLFALLLGVQPKQVHAWYLAVYIDAVEWVELPNTLGMSQYADGGLMGSKPYIATGKYIERMSGGRYCAGCRYDPALPEGEKACPYTTLYWDFLSRHAARLSQNPRIRPQVQNLARLTPVQRQGISERAAAIRDGTVGGA